MKRVVTLLLVLVLLLQSLMIMGLAADEYEDDSYVDDSYVDDTYVEEEHEESYADLFAWCHVRDLDDGERLRYGIDVSEHQGEIDWSAVADYGVDFAFIRVAFRSYSDGSLHEDGYWKENIENALNAGLQVGAYIYSQATTPEEAAEEAQYAYELVRVYELNLPLVMDFEYADNGYGNPHGRLYSAGLTNEDRTAVCTAFCKKAEELGISATVYASRSMLEDQMNSQELEHVWISHVSYTQDYEGDYDFWQCSFYGQIPGINEYVDCDIWIDDGTFRDYELLPFTDVTWTDWCYAAVNRCYRRGIISGSEEALFEPTAYASRAQVLTMLYRASGTPRVNSAAAQKLYAGYYAKAIAWALDTRLLHTTLVNVDPERVCTRQEMILMLYRLAGAPEVSGSLSSFSDAAQVRGYYKDAFLWAVQTGITVGNGHDKLKPTAKLDRASAAVLLDRYLALENNE